jgi:hypothetical protein
VKKSTAKKKRGAKPIPIDYDKIEKNAAMGLTKEEIGLALGFGRSSFYDHKANDPKIEEAIHRGRAKFKVFISDILIKQAQAGNASSAIWLDKTRCGTKEPTIGVNLTGDINANVSQETNDEKARRTRAEMIKALPPE